MFLNVNSHNENSTDLANCKVGESVTVSGMIHNVRVTKWGGFIVLRKSRGLLQAVVSNDTSKFFDENGETSAMNDLCREMAITITGTVNEAKIKDPAAFYNTI
jgi:aspartyl/asparaginyl-tRNA synthetase